MRLTPSTPLNTRKAQYPRIPRLAAQTPESSVIPSNIPLSLPSPSSPQLIIHPFPIPPPLLGGWWHHVTFSFSFSSPVQGTTSISGGSFNPRSCSQALILLSLSSHALHTPPPKTRVWRRHPSAWITSPLTTTEPEDVEPVLDTEEVERVLV